MMDKKEERTKWFGYVKRRCTIAPLGGAILGIKRDRDRPNTSWREVISQDKAHL